MRVFTPVAQNGSKHDPKWTDEYGLSQRSLNALNLYFSSEDDLRKNWPILVGEIPNFGRISIAEVGDVLGLSCPRTDSIADPKDLRSFTDQDLLKELLRRR